MWYRQHWILVSTSDLSAIARGSVSRVSLTCAGGAWLRSSSEVYKGCHGHSGLQFDFT